RAKRDVDIVCVDATNPFGNGNVLPAGRLREPLGNLKRADAIVITRANLAKYLDDLRSETSNLRSEIFTAETRTTSLIPIEKFPSESQGKENVFNAEKPFAFCGLGNPQSFFDQLGDDSIPLAGMRSFADHHKYDLNDIEAIESAAQKAGADCLVTTAKDAVKLSDLKFEMPCYIAEIKMIVSNVEAFRKLIISS
ncbi:MAG TPA: tetraacyldisaccharide 4'-kinase, partial [Pyrinomonadaceae bacterium]|nr:tetraacyldisaccharide 4'-kinase [Pyrinomonadaceae bacterium]